MLFCLVNLISASSLTVSNYYCIYIFNDANKVSLLSVCTIIPAIIMNMILPTLINNFGRRKILIFSAIGIAVSSGIMGLFPLSLVMVCAMYGVKGFFMGGMFACCYALTGDVIDFGEWKFGVRSEGLVNAGVSIGQKLGLGLGPAIAMWILGVGGYNGLAATQTASAMKAISFSFSFLSAIFAIIMLFVGLVYDMDKHSAQIQQDLTKKHKSN
jgi:GPH family glycoside/pentoside/hexuronide:cation symporter